MSEDDRIKRGQRWGSTRFTFISKAFALVIKRRPIRKKTASIRSMRLIHVAHYSQFACFPPKTPIMAFFLPPLRIHSHMSSSLLTRIKSNENAIRTCRRRCVIQKGGKTHCPRVTAITTILALFDPDRQRTVNPEKHKQSCHVWHGTQMFCQLMAQKSNLFSINIILETHMQNFTFILFHLRLISNRTC